MIYDWLIVGAGYSGAVMAERIATQLGGRVLVVDKRPHVAGNAYDEPDGAGILVHRYGPHLFHTNSQRVFEHLSQFTDWRPYSHRVLAEIDGKLVPVPFNLTSLRALFPAAAAARLERTLIEKYGYGTSVPILRMRTECEGELKELAEYIYDKVFRGYTTKQWGVTPEQLSPSVTSRVPINVSVDDRYFRDTYQAMPRDGYTALFKRMLKHKNIRLMLGVDYLDLPSSVKYKRMAYTGPIDAYFDYAHGELPYRSLRFEFESVAKPQYQAVAQVNYPNEHAYTRITEFKHWGDYRATSTTIAREYPQAHVVGRTDPFYPIPRDENREIFEKYKQETKKLNGHVVFCGRLADYQYYNMDQVVARALTVFEQEVATDVARVRGAGDARPRSAAA